MESPSVQIITFPHRGPPAYAHRGHLVLNNREQDAHRTAPNRRKSDAGRVAAWEREGHDNGDLEGSAMCAATRRRFGVVAD
jgi:hypothetical protein